jgi:uncharacterized membrane protein
MRLKDLSAALVAVAAATSQAGCVFVGGYSSEGGWYVWPGGFLITAVLLVLLWLFVRRRRGR